ncbi:MAG TPA: prenyltransferase [Spirochaetales bacterium]|nr:prenyltransferase [Spirochaetales bacterium]
MTLFERSPSALIRDLWKASRPLSLSLALYATSVPAALAVRDGLIGPGAGPRGWLLLALVTMAGLAIQGATNFINDFFECGQKAAPPSTRMIRFLGKEREAFSVLVFLAGLACFGLAGLIGLYLVATGSRHLLWVGALGLAGGYGYTGEPVVYKRFALGAILSFVLMGPLMNLGAWLGYGGALSWRPILLSLPVSLLVPAMMFSNEIRDVERDAALGIRTLTVRIGRRAGLGIYDLLLVSTFVLALVLPLAGLVPQAALAALVAMPLALRARIRVAAARHDAIPATNILHLVFGALWIAGIALG